MKIESIDKLKEVCSNVAAECYSEIKIVNMTNTEETRTLKFYYVIWYNKANDSFLVSDCIKDERIEVSSSELQDTELLKIIEEGRLYLS